MRKLEKERNKKWKMWAKRSDRWLLDDETVEEKLKCCCHTEYLLNFYNEDD